MFDKFKDECGVFGVYGHPEASKLTYLGLYALQHRGQESAGIASADGDRVRLVKKMGYVNEIFDEATLATLPGQVAIGHTRYSTAGDSKLSNAQPILIDCVHGQVGICHNGNIVNANEVRDRLVRAGSIFQTNSDTEVVLHLYARSQAGSVEDALVEAITQLTGAFSFALITKDSLIAVRDPHGFRPLALGRLGDAWAVTSETCALDLIGFHLRARRRARRGADHRPARPALGEAVPERAAVALHLRARLFRAARQRRVRPERQRSAHQPRPRAGARDRRRRRRGRADSRLGRVRGDRLLGRSEDPAALRADPQSLRRPHLHRAGAVDPSFRRQGEAQHREEHHQRQARGADRRLAGARHDQPQDRQDGARRRRRRSAPAHQLPADRVAVFLRRRYAAPRRS